MGIVSFHGCPPYLILYIVKYSQEFLWPHSHTLVFLLDFLESEKNRMGFSESELPSLVFSKPKCSMIE